MPNERKLLCDIAKLYYEENQTQAEIAQRFGISRPKVSRKLAEAREKGIVKIFIDSENDDIGELEQRLFSAFKLAGVRVASVPENDEALSVRLTAHLGASYLSEFLSPEDRIGVSWGWTLYEMTKEFPDMPLTSSRVVQITGGIDNARAHSYANEIVGNLARKINAATAHTLPCPAVVDSPIILDILMHDAKIKHVLDYGRACNKLFVNIALADKGSCLYQADYINDSDLARLERNKAVGSICCRFFDKDGNACDSVLNDRTVGLSIEDIKNAGCVMACIVGSKKARAVYCALKAGLIDVLVIDSLTAARVLQLVDAQGV